VGAGIETVGVGLEDPLHERNEQLGVADVRADVRREEAAPDPAQRADHPLITSR
jgi:hypothetical protein